MLEVDTPKAVAHKEQNVYNIPQTPFSQIKVEKRPRLDDQPNVAQSTCSNVDVIEIVSGKFCGDFSISINDL